ncbi:MAG TPA: hypothetical protein VJK47_04085 [Dehalococcoidales bacterium]|nr:hypothetical protein [Dehalococcoidales bacterium]
MNEYRGGNKAQKGVYLNRTNGELIQLYGETRILPGGGEVRYVKVPAILAMIGGPFAGLAFVFFLPTIGIIGILGYLAYKVWHGTAALGRKVFQPVAVRPEPGMAYLTQRRGAARKTEKAETGMEQIAGEVAKRRERGEK